MTGKVNGPKKKNNDRKEREGRTDKKGLWIWHFLFCSCYFPRIEGKRERETNKRDGKETRKVLNNNRNRDTHKHVHTDTLKNLTETREGVESEGEEGCLENIPAGKTVQQEEP